MAAASALAAVAATPEATPDEEGLMPSDADCQGKIFLLLMGNPGAGKSTLQSMYAGRPVFPVGLGLIGGTTKFTQFHPAPHTPEFKEAAIIQVDTPGLDDARKREQCCQQVVSALRVCGHKQLVFVLKADELRINHIEFKLIHLVLGALNDETKERVRGKFGIIVTKLHESIFEQTKQAEEAYGGIIKVLQESFPGLPAKNIALTPFSDFLRGKQQAAFAELLRNNEVSMEPKLRHFLNNMDAIMVPGECVNDIQDDEERMKELEEKLEKADEDYQARTLAMTEENKAELRKLAEEQKSLWERFGREFVEGAAPLVPLIAVAAVLCLDLQQEEAHAYQHSADEWSEDEPWE